MVQLHANDTGTLVGEITDDQLQFLVDQLEEESSVDQDYFIDAVTLEMLEGAGADATLMGILRNALGTREGLEIRWSRT